MAEIAVLGAGMVGICTALALQARGHRCLVVDRSPPGSETSYGNAGIIQAEAVEPYSLPMSPLAMLRLALGWKNAVNIKWRTLPQQMPALFSYWRSSSPASYRQIVPVWQQLVEEAVQRHGDLIDLSGAGHLIRRQGYWEAYNTAEALGRAIKDAERRRLQYGVEFTLADGAALRKSEPGLQVNLPGAIHWTTPLSCSSPGELVVAYGELFTRRGGEFLLADASTVARTGHGWKIGSRTVEHVVVALGPWSPEWLQRLDYRIPMVRKRGYHLHYRGDHGMTRPMLLAEHSVVLSPMRKGLRIATAAELSHGFPPASYPRQLAHGESVARTMLRIGSAVEKTAWAGTRPCLPGMLPLVCRAPRHSGLWVHFGHGHQGFTLGPVTAERLARAFDGDAGAVAGLDVGIG
jgi:D-amino-acid dehydrogenase